MDYVAAWYIKAAAYMQTVNAIEEKDLPKTRTAFVSTNSISQGEQVGVLWNELYNRYHCKIHFAHRTFKWGNEAKGNAAVHVVIVGFGNFIPIQNSIFEYSDIDSEPHEKLVRNISPYLVEGRDNLIISRAKPICNVSEMYKGSQPTDGGYFLFDDNEKNKFLEQEPSAVKYIKPFISSHEFINGEKRWCLWLVDAEPSELRKMPLVMSRIEGVKRMRLSSTKVSTQKWAQNPTLFTENRQPKSAYILVPSHSSENRQYIPIGFMSANDILNNSCFSIPNATGYEFGVLTSQMHMAWIKSVCGRLKSDYRYSNSLVYNNFPWPESPTEKQKDAVEKAAQAVLEARAQFPKSSLADLYDPNTMPPALVKAHLALDKAVDLCYRSQPFSSEAKRIEFLFELYEKYTGGLFVPEKKGKKK